MPGLQSSSAPPRIRTTFFAAGALQVTDQRYSDMFRYV